MSGISTEDVIKQSQSAYNQWKVQWRVQAKENSKWPMKSFSDFKYSGVGRAVLAVANGYSFEENIDVIEKYQKHVDIICVDKSLRYLLERGITPKFCMVCDANVSYEKYLEPWKDKVKDITLLMNVCGNPKWADNAEWKDRYFFVNKDVLKTEVEFSELSGCKNMIAAATNVSNAMVVLLTQCDNDFQQNFFGYDKILMIGFDYCWDENSYYAFDKDGGGKTNYMRACHVYNSRRDLVYTSTNLLFSAKWLDKYISAFRLPVIQCSDRSLVNGYRLCPDLGKQMQYNYKPEHSTEVVSLLDYKRKLMNELSGIEQKMAVINREHYKSLVRTT